MNASKFLVNSAGASLLLILLACGGSGVKTPSQFKGAFKAAYTNSLPTDGTCEIVVDSANAANIKVVDSTGTFFGNGKLSTAGQLNATLTDGTRTVDVSSLFVNTGGVTSATVNLSAPISGTNPAWTAAGTASFVAPTIGEVYSGTYNGTISGDVTGTVTVTVATDASAVVNITSAAGNYAGSGNVTNLGTLNILLNGSGAAGGKSLTTKGSFKITGLTLTGPKNFDGTYTVATGGTGTGTFTTATP